MLPVLVFLLWSLVEVHSQTFPRLSFMGQTLADHSYVNLSLVGRSDEDGDDVECITDLTTCCSKPQGSHRGDWYFPDGTRLPLPGGGDIYELRTAQRVDIRRGNDANSPTGIYRCDIATNAVHDATDISVRDTVYVGLYPTSGGDVLIPDVLRFTNLNGASPQFTLTCISTGGPATTVTWTRDSTTVTQGTQTVLNNPVTAQYTHTLTVTGRLGGLYNCTVSNNKPSVVSKTLTVRVAAAPTNLKFDVQSDGTSVLLTWIPPDPLGDTTGYTISYTGGGSSGSETVSGGDTNNYTLTGLIRGEMYDISIVGTSEHISSQSVEWETVTLVPGQTGGEENVGNDDSGGGGNTGVIVAGVLVPIVLIAVAAVLLLVVFLLWRRRRGSKDSRYSRSSPARPPPPSTKKTPPPVASSNALPPPVQYSKSEESVQYRHNSNRRANGKAPAIVEFPDDTQYVQEGEGVMFRVGVTGVPHPKLIWYHDGVEVVPDYSRELGEDGTLSMPSAETKHGGVYQLVAHNPGGRAEREVRLTVREEDEEEKGVSTAHELTPGTGLPVAMFGNFVEKCHSNQNQAFKDQYQGLYNGDEKSTATAINPDNKPKNRFLNICVYDDNRVMLRPLEGHKTDYINASYVDGYSQPGKFLATQGPLPVTVVDFWRLVWQERSPTVVMITNLVEGTKIKCHQYWPDKDSARFGPFEVSLIDQQTLADYTVRTLIVQLVGSSQSSLRVTHFHFTAWPDHGVPDYATPILTFHKRVVKEHPIGKGPIMVHCSAGVGRTGTFITIDHVLEQVGKENVVDIPGVINKIRHQRMKLVQTVDQYIFIHDAILESVTCGDTQIASSDLRRAIQQMGDKAFAHQFAVLEQVSPRADEVTANFAARNPDRNRSQEFLPADKWRVALRGDHPDYINAVFINGYKQQRAFIIAQSPMQSTARDFWKMVYDRKCGVVVMLCDLVETGKETCHQYWPSSGSLTVGEFKVDLLGEELMDNSVLKTLSVTHSETGKSHQVSQFHITNWAPDGSCGKLNSVSRVVEEMTKIQRRTGNHTITVHCSDTVSRSGMFCAIATTIERCKTEGVVDVFQVVKALRVQKPGAVRTVMQYKTIFEAVLVFLDSFDTYANF